MFKAFMDSLVLIVPRLSNPIQLAAFVFALLCWALIVRVDPNNITAISLVGAIGLAVITIPLTFRKAIVNLIPLRQRALFLLAMLGLFLGAFGGLAATTVSYAFPSPQGSRFDAVLREDTIKVFRMPDGKYRMQLTWQFEPLSKAANEGATVFTGIVVIHDEELIERGGLGTKTAMSCDEVSSCLGSLYFDKLSGSPTLVRSGTTGSPFTATVDIKKMPRLVRVWWEFYQAEGLGGTTCKFDFSVVVPSGYVPKLALYKGDIKVGDLCYRSYGQRTLKKQLE